MVRCFVFMQFYKNILNLFIMKKIITLILLLSLINANSQIGGGWDWAYNTGAINPSSKHIGYNAAGEMLIIGKAAGGMYLGADTVSTTPVFAGVPNNLIYLAKISTTGTTSIIRSIVHPYIGNITVATTDSNGNFYVAMSYSAFGGVPIDIGNGISLDGLNKVAIMKFSATGTTLWAKTYDLGYTYVSGVAADLSVRKLAVSNQGKIFFVAAVTGATVSPSNYSVYKLDSSGNTLWTKYASFLDTATTITTWDSDKFVDSDENIYLTSQNTSNIVFDGVTSTAAGNSHFIALNSNGVTRWIYSFNGNIRNLVVDKTTNNIYFGWSQTTSNSGILSGLPVVSSSPSAPHFFSGVVKCNSMGNVILTNTTAPSTQFIPAGQDRLLMATIQTANTSFLYGSDYFFPVDALQKNLITETDSNLNVLKVISGGRSTGAGVTNLAAFGNTYGIVGYFSGTNPALPTCTYGSTTLTGYNAVTNLATNYPSYVTAGGGNFDEAYAQFKSANVPVANSTTWLGANNNWNDAANWTNGVPTNVLKVNINNGLSNYPTTFTAPTAGVLQISAGVTITFPAATTAGFIINDGLIKINNAGFFQTFGAKEWKGSGTVEFLGASTTFGFFSFPFTNAITLNGPFLPQTSMSIRGVNFNSTAGRLDMGGNTIAITDPSPTSITGISATNYFTNGTLRRAINSTGLYEFPLGSNTNFQSATINTNGLAGVNSIAATFNSGAITGTTPNVTFGGATISSGLNGGWYAIIPNQQPTSGSYDVTLKIKNSTNSVVSPAKYTVIKRDNATSPWAVQGNYTLASIVSGTVTASNTGLTSFSDFAIGITNQDVVLATNSFEKEAFKLSVYPNPTNSSLNLQLPTSTANATLKIISITGQTVFEKQSINGTDFNFDVSNLNSGLYLIQISDGQNNFSSKFVKQ